MNWNRELPISTFGKDYIIRNQKNNTITSYLEKYEPLMKIVTKIDQYYALKQISTLQTELQQFINKTRFSDALTLAGIPF